MIKKTSNLLLLILTVWAFAGCRVYVGYRTYDERAPMELTGSVPAGTEYSWGGDKNTLSLIEKKKHNLTYSQKCYKVTEYIYKNNNIIKALILKTILSPISALYLTLFWLASEEQQVSYLGNTYIFSRGRQYWNSLNPFIAALDTGPAGAIVGTEETRDLVSTIYDYKDKEESGLSDTFLRVHDGERSFDVQNGLTVQDLREKVFKYAFPEQTKTLTITGEGQEKTLTLNSLSLASQKDQERWKKILNLSEEQCFWQEKKLMEDIGDFRYRKLLSDTTYEKVVKDISRKSIKGKNIFEAYDQAIDRIRLAH